MTAAHKAAISRGLKALRIRRRRSAAMIASWKRRRGELIHLRVAETAPEVRNNNTNQLDAFSRIELACKLWKNLETERTWYQNYPAVAVIVDGAIASLRLEIMLVCKEYLGETD